MKKFLPSLFVYDIIAQHVISPIEGGGSKCADIILSHGWQCFMLTFKINHFLSSQILFPFSYICKYFPFFFF